MKPKKTSIFFRGIFATLLRASHGNTSLFIWQVKP
uniref:Uncharacterized protein n=1 Tax=Anguilla anguilla TaxID=7936 RepID=A0A0E9S1N4_ANGAN